MRIRVGFDLVYDCPQPTPMLVMLRIHPSRDADVTTPDLLRTDPAVPIETYVDSFGNRCGRVLAPAGKIRFSTDAIVLDSGLTEPVVPEAAEIPVPALPEDSLVFLLGSRYCQTDLMSETAWKLFGTGPTGWAKVQAICDFVHEHVRFGYDHARPTKSAWDVYEERTGVCRDFAHLAITLCRCMNIPARYCTGYLGDIGLPPDPAPMDFSAWFEAYLGGRWYTFDARHNKPRIGRVLMARGRDAADVALSNSFGMTTLAGFKVWSEEVTGWTRDPAEDA
ncbi:transglutaminase-like putative cysteine protease [Inquilinus ginsengisoli]|uniref:Transglutaminase-like putative cysteine protease n=1 Tax=Inquilinus ginsengisoli TaxID=363840 RepID=A0ABU1JW15_9PROT|nr:transglutaminase family protein [Inquilinus ginsengisoli]MDR6292796.1 transglutaminase-like putative cysteine protease [Inquilinus ginsengisoli]